MDAIEDFENELISVSKRLMEIDAEQKELEKRSNDLKKIIEAQWVITETTEKIRGGVKLELLPIDKWSINQDDVDEDIVELFAQCGLQDKIKHNTISVNPISFNAALKKITAKDGEFRFLPEEILKKYPKIKRFQGTFIDVKIKN